MRFAHIARFAFWEPLGIRFEVHFGSILKAIWDPGHPENSKWPSKGPAREPTESLEANKKAGWKIDDFGHAWEVTLRLVS